MVIELQPGATAAVTATLELHEQPLASISSAEAAAASPGQAELLAAEKLRLQAHQTLTRTFTLALPLTRRRRSALPYPTCRARTHRE